MKNYGKVARAATSAGLALGMLFGAAAPALAATGKNDTPVPGEYANPEYSDQVTGESTGDTKLYVIAKQDALTTQESAIHENIKVTIPVAIHYVADAEGNLTGPSDDCVEIVNNTKLGAVHVSRIAVTSEGNAIMCSMADATENDRVALLMTPEGGTQDELGNYVTAYDSNDTEYTTSVPMYPNEWNIYDPSTGDNNLYLNGLTGKIGGFRNLNPSTSALVGTIHWTVRSGTYDQSNYSDSIVTIHYNANDGWNGNCIPVGDQQVVVLDQDFLPDKIADDIAMETPLTDPNANGAELVTPPLQRTNANGTVTKWTFEGWYDGPGDTNIVTGQASKKISTLADLGDAEDIAGQIFEVYAHYTPTTYDADGNVTTLIP